MSLHRYRASSNAVTPDYTAAVEGTADNQYVSTSDAESLAVGQVSSGEYTVLQAYLSFDSSGEVAPPTTLELVLTVSNNVDMFADWLLGISPHDFGTVDITTWYTPADINGTFASVSVKNVTGTYNQDDTFTVTLDPSYLNVGGITKLVLFSADSETETPPGGIQAIGFYGDGGTTPPFLLVDGVPLDESGGPGVPTCTSAIPDHGSTDGGTSVTLTGTNLTGATDVLFGAVPATSFNVDSDTQITAIAPAHDGGVVNVTVTTPGGTTSPGPEYTYIIPGSGGGGGGMTVVRWIFEDPTDLTTQTFEVNPNEGGSPTYEKNITQVSTLTPSGRTLAFEGAKKNQTIEFSGVVLTETMYNMMVLWFNKSYQIQLTDDLGRVMMIYIDKFEPKRVRKPSIPFYHTYTVTALILDWPA